MVFWMSIAFVPIFATEGRYLDLIWDKTVAALIGGWRRRGGRAHHRADSHLT